MKYWFDTEFIEDGRTIDLLSLGIVAEDGRELYLENSEADLNRASDWVREHVFPGMLWTEAVSFPRCAIAAKLQAFVANGPVVTGDPRHLRRTRLPKTSVPEFWAYYADYDWVVLCQLYGRMIDLPKGWPMFCRDFKQLVGDQDIAKLPEAQAHNALNDARWLRDSFNNFYDRADS